jgi:hypothetical protein
MMMVAERPTVGMMMVAREETAMRVRQPPAMASGRWNALACCITVAALLTMAAGCGSPAPKPGTAAKRSATSAGATSCGTTRTAANVPVQIQIARGQVSCSTALTVERDYAKAIQSGKVAGTGGGAPVHVQGWVCQGFTTPVVLKTGQASKCVQGSSEILAILPAPA